MRCAYEVEVCERSPCAWRTLQKLPSLAIEGKDCRPDLTSTEDNKNVIEHLMDFGFSSRLFSRQLGDELPTFLPVLKGGGDDPPSPFQRSDIVLDESHRLRIQGTSIQLFDHHAGKRSAEYQRKKRRAKNSSPVSELMANR